MAPTEWTNAEAKAVALGGHLVTINNAAENTWVYNTFANYGGTPRPLFIGFTDQGHEGQWVWTSGEPVTYTHWNAGEPNNGAGVDPNENYSMMYPSGGPAPGPPGYWNDIMGIYIPRLDERWYGVVEVNSLLPGAAPLVEWFDPTNITPQGVQLWLGGLPGTNVPGAILANIWDTNLQPHTIATAINAITNGGWQHIALTYNTNTANAILYTNGQPAATVHFLTNFVPRTSGDLYFGFHPPGLTNGTCYPGGLDEFSLYRRALSPCEVNAIYNAGSRGKYGTNVLVCPVETEVTLLTASGNQTYTFTNGITWTNNGPHWETNFISFLTSSNPTPIIVRGLDPYDPADTNAGNNLNAVVDDFVLSALVTNVVDGLLHFTENTNLAAIPIKFAPAPYLATNFPPVLIFSNDFDLADRRALPDRQHDPRGCERSGPWCLATGRSPMDRSPWSATSSLARFPRPTGWPWPPARCSACCPPPPATVTS